MTESVSVRRLLVSERRHFVYFLLTVGRSELTGNIHVSELREHKHNVVYPSASLSRSATVAESIKCFWRIKPLKSSARGGKSNMSAEQRMFLSPSSPFSPAAVEGLGGVDPPSGPLAEMDTLRMFVTERLAAAVDDILGVFVKTVSRYREQIDRQRRQLDTLRSEEGKWSQTAGPLESCSHSGRI